MGARRRRTGARDGSSSPVPSPLPEAVRRLHPKKTITVRHLARGQWAAVPGSSGSRQRALIGVPGCAPRPATAWTSDVSPPGPGQDAGTGTGAGAGQRKQAVSRHVLAIHLPSCRVAREKQGTLSVALVALAGECDCECECACVFWQSVNRLFARLHMRLPARRC